MFKWLKKQFNRMTHSLQNTFFSLQPRTRMDYGRAVGRGDGSSVVMAPVKFIQRVFPEAPLKLRKINQNDEEILDDHPFIQKIRKPNPFYSGNNLWREGYHRINCVGLGQSLRCSSSQHELSGRFSTSVAPLLPFFAS